MPIPKQPIKKLWNEMSYGDGFYAFFVFMLFAAKILFNVCLAIFILMRKVAQYFTNRRRSRYEQKL